MFKNLITKNLATTNFLTIGITAVKQIHTLSNIIYFYSIQFTILLPKFQLANMQLT